MLPFSLDIGVKLERQNLQLKWGDDLVALQSTDHWEFVSQLDKTCRLLVWNELVWDGLSFQVSTVLKEGARLSEVKLVPKEYWAYFKTAPQVFAFLRQALKNRFGPSSKHDQSEESEVTCWMLGNLTIRHEYFGGMPGYHHILVKHYASEELSGETT